MVSEDQRESVSHMFNSSNFANVTTKGFVICAVALIGMYKFNGYVSS